ncbi:MAG: C1 family peptidase [Anaerolineae bacterium]
MAEKQGTSLTGIEGFPEEAANRLAESWITTAEELVSAARQEDGPAGLAEYLGLTEDEVTALIEQAVDALPEDVTFAPDDVMEVGLGALDEPEGAGPDDEPVAFGEPLPSAVNLAERMPAIRHQRNRGTCVAHACVAVQEFLQGEASTESDLSEQFVYWACKERDDYPGGGTWIKYGMAVLEELGVCVEQVWPYNPDPIEGNEGQGPPPDEAQADAALRRVKESSSVEPRWTTALRQVLAEGKPVAFAVPVYRYWVTEPVRSSGDIRMPLPHDHRLGGHAMCMVGYEDDPNVPGGGFFLIRNSWGTDWAKDSKMAAGYARLPYEYMTRFGRSAYSATAPEPKPDPDNWLQRLLKILFG